MKIHLKALLILGLTIAVLFAGILLLASTVILNQFALIEDAKMQQYADRFRIDLQREIAPVTATVAEWAAWDEAYGFVQSANPEFTERVFTPDALKNLRLDFIAYWDASGRLLLARNRDASARADIPADRAAGALVAQNLVPQTVARSSRSGLVLIGDALATVSAFPVTRTDETGPVMGTVAGGHFLEQAAIDRLQKFTDFRLRFISFQELASDPRLVGELPALLQSTGLLVRRLDEREVAAYLLLRDAVGEPVIVAELKSPRALFQQGRRSIQVFLVALVLGGGVLFFGSWLSLDANVLCPMRNLAGQVEAAARAGKPPRDLGFHSNDELDGLARRIEKLATSLLAAQASYRAVVEDQTEYICRYRPDGSITFVNEAYCRFRGRDRAALLGTNIFETVAAADRERVSKRIAALSADDPVAAIEHRAVAPDGAIIWHRRTDRAIFDANGARVETQCVARDVTDRHHARVALEGSEARYRRLFETSADGVILVDSESRAIADVNPALCQILGRSREYLVGRSLAATLPFDAFEREHSVLDRIERDGRFPHEEVEFVNADGAGVIVELTGTSFAAADRIVIQINLRDITDRKRADENLRNLSGRFLRLQDDERRRIARELHDSTAQNLAALELSISQLAPHVSRDDARIAKLLSGAHELASQCCQEVRTLSYLLHPPLLDEVGLPFALQWYADGFMNRTGRIVVLDLPDAMERLPAETETSLFRIVQEALSNIHKHSGSRKAWIRLARESGSILLEIRDEGSGIQPGRIAELNNSDTPNLGVGLAGMRERLRQLDGRLEIVSDRRGTTIRAIVRDVAARA